ncbi:hypothetical protein [Streptomyces niveus]|uniref:hypothetical protein n=1 Tax=Streptomyces niveus TaxID=193462 RepID=UPI0036D36E6E
MTDTLRRVALTAVTGLGLCLTLLPAGQANAQPTTRIPCNDVAALKAAITTANTSGGTITLAPHCVYTLTQADNPDDGLPEITGNVRIHGDHTTIQRASGATGAFRIFHVTQGGRLSLDSLTVRGGEASGDGFAAGGGGIFNDHGKVTLTGVTIRSNRADFIAGGVWNQLGTLVLKATTIHDNTSRVGGAVVTSGTMTMEGGALRGNTADSWAGALANGGDTKLNHVTVENNDSDLGGGIMTMRVNSATGPLRLDSTQVSGNIAALAGGGIFIGTNESTTLHGSTVTRNTANGGPTEGGGINNDGRGFAVIIRTTGSPEHQEGKADDSPEQPLPTVNLIKSTVVKNTPTNCAPPGSVPGCAADGHAPPTTLSAGPAPTAGR